MAGIRPSAVEGSRSHVVLGAYARIDPKAASTLRAQLRDLEGVTLFDLDDPGKLGLVLEAEDSEQVHRRLTSVIARMPGVLGVWPISLEFEDSPA